MWTSAGGSWGVDHITEPGSGSTTTYTRDPAGRVSQILGPVPAGVTCTTPGTTPGCRTLTLTYATSTTATASSLGDYTGRLSGVTFTAYDPAHSVMTTVPIAAYGYDTTGHLRQAWDPRISPALKTGYTYDSTGRLATLTPPGEQPWTFGYDTGGRLATVRRRDPANNADAISTLAYQIPLSGSGAPVDMTGPAVAAWGQADLPEVAAAVFEPNHLPAGTPTVDDLKYADLSYLDVNGRTVNTIGWTGSGWATTENLRSRDLQIGVETNMRSSGDLNFRIDALRASSVYSDRGLESVAKFQRSRSCS